MKMSSIRVLLIVNDLQDFVSMYQPTKIVLLEALPKEGGKFVTANLDERLLRQLATDSNIPQYQLATSFHQL